MRKKWEGIYFVTYHKHQKKKNLKPLKPKAVIIVMLLANSGCLLFISILMTH